MATPDPGTYSGDTVIDPVTGAQTGKGTFGSTIKNYESGTWTLNIANTTTGGYGTVVAKHRALVYDSNGKEYWAYFNENFELVHQEATGRTKLGANVAAEAAKSAGGGGSGGGGGGTSAAATVGMGYIEAFFAWMGRNPTEAEKTRMAEEGWTEDTIRKYAVANGGTGPEMLKAKNTLRQLAAPFYGGDPSLLPESEVKALISSGYYADASYLRNTYFPALKSVDGTNPLAADYIETWHTLVGEDKPLTTAALGKMNETIKAYGFTAEGTYAFGEWAKKTEAAYTGAYGASQRANITQTFNTLLGRNPSAVELSNKSIYWGMTSDQLQETLLQTPEGRTIYKNKPAWETPTDYIARLQSIDQVLRWYYGDHFVANADGSLTYKGTPTPTYSKGIPEIPAYDASVAEVPAAAPAAVPAAAPAWKSLTMDQFAIDLKTYGIDVQDGKYFKAGKEITLDELEKLLPSDVYYKDEKGFHYVQEPGAIDKYGNPALKYKGVV